MHNNSLYFYQEQHNEKNRRYRAFSSVFAVSAVQAAGNGTINFTGAVNNRRPVVLRLIAQQVIRGGCDAKPTVQANIFGYPGNVARSDIF